MTKQDWRNPEDYVYTSTLGYEGWAWEFLRRNLSYRDFYAENAGLPDATAGNWGLLELYDPDQLYNEGIKFFRADPFPIISGFPTLGFCGETENVTVDFPNMMPATELIETHLSDCPSDVLVIAVRAGKPIPAQLDAVRAALEEHEKQFIVPEDIRLRVPEFTRYIRMLDALRCSEGELTQVEMMKLIHPDKTWPDGDKGERLGYDKATDNQITDYASETVKKANEHADFIYRRYIRRVQGIA